MHLFKWLAPKKKVEEGPCHAYIDSGSGGLCDDYSPK